MTDEKLTEWATRILQTAKSGQHNEDSLVELKSVWPESPINTARRLAGFANSARGQEILLLIGVNEHAKTIVGAEQGYLNDWWPQIKRQFENGHAPELDRDLVVSFEGTNVVALLFQTNQPPYLVKVTRPVETIPKEYKKDYSTLPKFEVPWREGTSTRTAMREDLLKLLRPLTAIPDFVVRTAKLSADNGTAILELGCYVSPQNDKTLTIPFHSCDGWYHSADSDDRVEFKKITLAPPKHVDPVSMGDVIIANTVNASKTIDATPTELLINGPGQIIVTARGPLGRIDDPRAGINIHLELGLVNSERRLEIEKHLSSTTGDQWVWPTPQ
jgi:hypothetical protein